MPQQVTDIDTGINERTNEERGQGMAMMTLEKAALKLTTELMLPPYAVTPSTLCEWSRKSQGTLVDIQFLHGGQVRNASDAVVNMPGESYFTVPCDFLFDLEMHVDVLITSFFKRGEAFYADAPIMVKACDLRVDRQQITQLISFIQKIGTNQTLLNEPAPVPFDITVEEALASDAIAAVKLELVRTAPVKTGSAKSKPVKNASTKASVKLVAVNADSVIAEPISMEVAKPSEPQPVSVQLAPFSINCARPLNNSGTFWQLNPPSEADVLTNIVYSVLNEKLISGAPCPSAREVMTLCKKKNKYGVLYIKSELKFLNEAGQLETASVMDVSEKILELTTMSGHVIPPNLAELMPAAPAR